MATELVKRESSMNWWVDNRTFNNRKKIKSLKIPRLASEVDYCIANYKLYRGIKGVHTQRGDIHQKCSFWFCLNCVQNGHICGGDEQQWLLIVLRR